MDFIALHALAFFLTGLDECGVFHPKLKRGSLNWRSGLQRGTSGKEPFMPNAKFRE